jgi:hypothetical protein
VKRKFNSEYQFLISHKILTVVSNTGLHSKLHCAGETGCSADTPQNDVGTANVQNPSATCVDQLRILKGRVVDSGDDSDSNLGSKNALYYLERLRALQEQAGLDPSALLLDSKQQVPRDTDDNAVNDENLNKKPFVIDMPEEVSFVCL